MGAWLVTVCICRRFTATGWWFSLELELGGFKSLPTIFGGMMVTGLITMSL
jgi:hypothetical protein